MNYELLTHVKYICRYHALNVKRKSKLGNNAFVVDIFLSSIPFRVHNSQYRKFKVFVYENINVSIFFFLKSSCLCQLATATIHGFNIDGSEMNKVKLNWSPVITFWYINKGFFKYSINLNEGKTDEPQIHCIQAQHTVHRIDRIHQIEKGEQFQFKDNIFKECHLHRNAIDRGCTWYDSMRIKKKVQKYLPENWIKWIFIEVLMVFYRPMRGLSVLFDFEKFVSKPQGNFIPFHVISFICELKIVHQCIPIIFRMSPHTVVTDQSTFNQTANRPMNGSQKFVQKNIMVIKLSSIQLKYK